jgi:hypothetical protein
VRASTTAAQSAPAAYHAFLSDKGAIETRYKAAQTADTHASVRDPVHAPGTAASVRDTAASTLLQDAVKRLQESQAADQAARDKARLQRASQAERQQNNPFAPKTADRSSLTAGAFVSRNTNPPTRQAQDSSRPANTGAQIGTDDPFRPSVPDFYTRSALAAYQQAATASPTAVGGRAFSASF